MLTTAVNGMAALRCVGGTPGKLNRVSHGVAKRKRWGNEQPIKLPVMCELEDEFVDHTVDTYRPTHELQIGVRRVVEDEVVAVEDAEIVSPDATGDLSTSVSRLLEQLATLPLTVGMWLT